MNGKEREGALGVYRVLDLTDHRGTYCARLLADLGADVIKIEQPRGGKARTIPPFANDSAHHEKSLFFLYRNANKRGITLNLEASDGRAIFLNLVKTADIVVDSFAPGYMKELGLDYAVLRQINPGLIMASITDFGQNGPYRDWKGSDIVDFALSGAMIGSGYPDGKPTVLPGSPGDDGASLYAAAAIVASVYTRGRTGKGCYIDASIHQCSRLALYPWGLVMWYADVEPNQPLPPPHGRLGTMIYPIFPCKDGYIRLVALTTAQWEALLRVIGEPEELRGPEWREFLYRFSNADKLYSLMQEFTSRLTMEELTERGHAEGVPIAPIYDIPGFINSPQTKAREYYVTLDHPVVGKFLCPGPPYKFSETSCAIRRPAPGIGEHNEDIYCGELEYSRIELGALRQSGVI